MKRRAFLGLGASSIGVGALYGTGAFSSVSAGRGVSVSAADDLNALLRIETYDGEEIDDTNEGTSDTAEVAELTNNLNQDINSITAEVTSVQDDDDDALEVANKFELSDGVNSGGEVSIELGCGGIETEGVSDVFITIQDAEASSVTISDKTVRIEDVEYNCGGGSDSTEDGDIEFVYLRATVSTDNQGDPESVTFEYDITERADIVFDTTLRKTDSERVEDALEGTITIDRGSSGQQEFPVGVEGDIDGGELCGTQIEEDQAGETVDIC